MDVELKPWDSAELLHNEQDLFEYLSVVLEDDDGPTIYAKTLRTAVRARGGVTVLSRESGIPEQELQTAMNADEASALPVLRKLEHAYRMLAANRMVA